MIYNVIHNFINKYFKRLKKTFKYTIHVYHSLKFLWKYIFFKYLNIQNLIYWFLINKYLDKFSFDRVGKNDIDTLKIWNNFDPNFFLHNFNVAPCVVITFDLLCFFAMLEKLTIWFLLTVHLFRCIKWFGKKLQWKDFLKNS